MENTADIGIISIFQRGNWLASELSQSGKRVALIDMSSLFSRWTPSDWEGPFGIFKTPALQESQLFYLLEGESVIDSQNGFCLWPTEGPIELRGPIRNLQLERLKSHKNIESFFRSMSNDEDMTEGKKQISKQKFHDTWPAYLSFHLASTRAVQNHESLKNALGLPFFAPHSYRLASRMGLEEALDSCQNSGVNVFRNAVITDINEAEKNILQLEITSNEMRSIQKAKKWIIMLTSSELQALPEKVRDILHPYPTLEPDWAWVRYSIEVEAKEELKVLPRQFVIIEDEHAPWYETNLLACNRTMKENQLDVWLRIPNAQRFQKQCLEELSEKIQKILLERIPVFRILEVQMPQEYLYGFSDLGPARFSMYSEESIENRKRKKWKNVTWSNPEDWQAQDWSSQMNIQRKLFQNIKENVKND